MTKVVVISSREQWHALKHIQSDLKIYCDNPRLYDFLKSERVVFTELNEFMIPEDERRSMNAWGRDRAAHWIKYCKERGYFTSLDLPSMIFLRFGYILVQLLKNNYYAKYILNASKPDQVIVFDIANKPDFPKFSGNIWLTAFLEEIAIDQGLTVENIKVNFESDHQLKGLLTLRQRITVRIKESIRALVQIIYGKLRRPPKKIDLLVSGSLRHLSSVIDKIVSQRQRIAFYDDQFQLKHFEYASQRKIPYLIAACFSDSPLIDKESLSKRLNEDLHGAMKDSRGDQIFVYQGKNFADVIYNHVISTMEIFTTEMAELSNHAENMLASCSFRGLLQDQDTAGKPGFKATYLSQKGIHVFTVSHAVAPVDFYVDVENQMYGPAITFVNSQYEKDMYVARGWNAKRILVTGVPRFDRFSEGLESPGQMEKGNLKVLYLGASMKKYWPERGGYLGYQITNNGDSQRKSLNLILKALEEYERTKPVEVVLKPHNFEGDSWSAFVEGLRLTYPIHVASYDEDLLAHLRQADVMILAHWSTAIIEAALLRKPIIMVDLFQSKNIAPYEEYGICKVVRNREELIQALGELACYRPSSIDTTFCIGKRDKNNTKRTVQAITFALDSNDTVHS